MAIRDVAFRLLFVEACLEVASAAVLAREISLFGSDLARPEARGDGYCLSTFGRCEGELLLSSRIIANMYGCDEKCFEVKECNW